MDEKLSLIEWNEKFDCGVIGMPEDKIAKKALAMELRGIYGIIAIDEVFFIVDFKNKKTLKEDIFKLAKKYNQNIAGFFSKEGLNLLNFDGKFKISNGFSNMTNAILAGKFIKEYENRFK